MLDGGCRRTGSVVDAGTGLTQIKKPVLYGEYGYMRWNDCRARQSYRLLVRFRRAQAACRAVGSAVDQHI